MTAPPDDTTADTSAIIAALRTERDAGLAREATLADALATRNREYGERIEQQAATIDVLRAMSASPGDARPVFELIVERARSFCGADHATAALLQDDMLYLQAHSGMSAAHSADYAAQFPRPVDTSTMFGRAILSRDVMQTGNLPAERDHFARQMHTADFRSIVAVPIFREGAPIGAIALGQNASGGFTDTQIELLKTFAEQAVIAIASAETYRALQERTAALAQRNSEHGERIEQQSATIDVLKVMSGSPGDTRPVFELVVERAREFCNADYAAAALAQGGMLHLQAASGMTEGIAQGFAAMFPRSVGTDTLLGRAILSGAAMQSADVMADPEHFSHGRAVFPTRSVVAVPLLRGGSAIGALTLARRTQGEFSATQMELLRTFAEQAVIAITSAETYRALQTRTADLQESLEYQTATSDVLKVISRSTFDLQPVLDAVVETAARLCDADMAHITRREGEAMHFAANYGFPPEYEKYLKARGPAKLDPNSPTIMHRTWIEGRPVHVDDVAAVPGYPEVYVRLSKQRTSLGVPLLRGGETIGVIQVSRQRVQPFTDRQIALVSTFADQAVIAIENTRLITEQREALEQQTATAEVLQVINASPGNLAPVFETILEKAHRLCEATKGAFITFDGEYFQVAATRGLSDAYSMVLRNTYNRPIHAVDAYDERSPRQQLLRGADLVHLTGAAVAVGPVGQAAVKLEKIGTVLFVPLRRDGVLLGYITAYREEVSPFTDKQIALLKNFAAQAIIAMENARLLDEIRQRQAELRVTFDNMGDGVVMFDAEHRLAACNSNFQELLDIPDAALAKRPSYADYLRLLTERGEFGAENIEAELTRRLEETDRELRLERMRPDGRVVEVRRNAVPDGGFVLIYSDITERKRSEAEIRAARDAAEAAYRELKAAQANLIQAEKMASLGQLTAGIAHEIKNPLNFVNNFAALSVDLLSELKEAAAPGFAALSSQQRAEVDDVSAMLTSNLEKITEHGKRADSIVKAMLEHSRGSSGERRMVDLNALIDEALNLAYHGARAQDQSFNIMLERDLGAGIAPIEVSPQDMTRVFLNLFSNGFYAATRRVHDGGAAGFVPTLKVATRDAGEAVEIRVRDNGTGIPDDIRDKLFQPFFTTKPTGEGTGLGLSITYDIVTQQHSGSIVVDSKVGEYSEFTIRLPRKP